MPFFLWSRTPANNGTADPTCPWPEGMAPAQVNDSARGNMARLREFADDIAGAIVTAGLSSAYTIASYEAFDSLAHLGGNVIAFTPHTGNASPVTLNVDGLGARPLRLSPGVEVPPATLVQGTPYAALYNAVDGAFYLRGFLNLPYSVPIGGLMPFLSTAVPNSNFVLPYGQALSRATYAALFALIGTTFGSGDGLTTFNIPDLRGRVPVAQDNMGGVAAGRVTLAASGIDGTTMGFAGGGQAKTLLRSDLPNTNASVTVTSDSHAHATGIPGGNGSISNINTGMFLFATNFVQNASIGSQNTSGFWTGYVNLNGGVAQTNVNGMPPSIVVPYILRVI